MPIPRVCIHWSVRGYPKKTVSTRNPNPTTPNPMLIEKKEMFNRNKVGLPVFLNPTYAKIPRNKPTKKPKMFNVDSSKNSK